MLQTLKEGKSEKCYRVLTLKWFMAKCFRVKKNLKTLKKLPIKIRLGTENIDQNSRIPTREILIAAAILWEGEK